MRDRVSAVKVSMRDRVPEVWLRILNGWHAARVSAEVQKISMRDRVSSVYIVSLETGCPRLAEFQ